MIKLTCLPSFLVEAVLFKRPQCFISHRFLTESTNSCRDVGINSITVLCNVLDVTSREDIVPPSIPPPVDPAPPPASFNTNKHLLSAAPAQVRRTTETPEGGWMEEVFFHTQDKHRSVKYHMNFGYIWYKFCCSQKEFYPFL